MFMPVQQAKVPVLHFFAPCSPQGLQAGRGSASMTRLSLLKGPKPKSGVVEQNTAVTGASTAEQRCRGAESQTKFIFAPCMSAALSKRDNSPQRLSAFLFPLRRMMSPHCVAFSLLPSRNTLASDLCFAMKESSSTHFSLLIVLVSQSEQGERV